MALFNDDEKRAFWEQVESKQQPSPTVTTSTPPMPMETRMEVLARRLRSLAYTFTILGVIVTIGSFLASENSSAVFLAGAAFAVSSSIGWWVLYGFAWALADFKVSTSLPPSPLPAQQ